MNTEIQDLRHAVNLEVVAGYFVAKFHELLMSLCGQSERPDTSGKVPPCVVSPFVDNGSHLDFNN